MSRDDEQPLWAGRFGKPPAPEARALGASLAFDVRLAAQDVEASISTSAASRRPACSRPTKPPRWRTRSARCKRRSRTGLRRAPERRGRSLSDRARRHRRLGDLGARLHAGRSRNDLVVADLRLWLLAAGRRIDGLTVLLVRALVDHAAGAQHGRPGRPTRVWPSP